MFKVLTSRIRALELKFDWSSIKIISGLSMVTKTDISPSAGGAAGTLLLAAENKSTPL